MSKKKRGRLKRILDAARGRSGDEETDAGALVSESQEQLPAVPRSVQAVLTFLERRIEDLVDATSSRLLALDDDAAQLAYLVEQAAEAHGRDAVVSIVLRRNLLLNGTMLAFIEPMLTGRGALRVDDETLAAGRQTLVSLLVDVADLDVPEEAPPTDEADVEGRVAWLDEVLFEGRFDGIRELLLGHGEAEETARFLLGSYTLFLQTFLMRTLAKSVGRFRQLEGAAPADKRLDADES